MIAQLFDGKNLIKNFHVYGRIISMYLMRNVFIV
jgi:hypothetical protein